MGWKIRKASDLPKNMSDQLRQVLLEQLEPETATPKKVAGPYQMLPEADQLRQRMKAAELLIEAGDYPAALKVLRGERI